VLRGSAAALSDRERQRGKIGKGDTEESAGGWRAVEGVGLALNYAAYAKCKLSRGDKGETRESRAYLAGNKQRHSAR